MSDGRKNRHHGPAGPSKSLGDSFEDTRRIYSTFGHGQFSRSEIASALNVSANSGPFAMRFHTLKSYGMITAGSDGFVVSDHFRQMAESDGSGDVFSRLAFDAIQKPQLFMQLIKEFRGKLPAPEQLIKRLELKIKMSPTRASTTARVLRDSLKFAGVLDARDNIIMPRVLSNAPLEEGAGDFPEPSESGISPAMPSNQTSVTMLEIQVPLGDDRVVKINYPRDLSLDDAAKIGTIIKAVAS